MKNVNNYDFQSYDIYICKSFGDWLNQNPVRLLLRSKDEAQSASFERTMYNVYVLQLFQVRLQLALQAWANQSNGVVWSHMYVTVWDE